MAAALPTDRLQEVGSLTLLGDSGLGEGAIVGLAHERIINRMDEEPLDRRSRQRGQPLESQLERIDLLAGRIRVHHQLDTPLPRRQEGLHHVSQGGVHHHHAGPGHGRPRRENQLDHVLLSEGQQRLRLPHPRRLPGGKYDPPETRRGSSLVHHGFKPPLPW